jgi:TNF receptor-associated protein 1
MYINIYIYIYIHTYVYISIHIYFRDVTTAQYDEFYKYVANAYDKPMFTLHFRADAPIDLKCLLYIPSIHSEKFGQGRMEPG